MLAPRVLSNPEALSQFAADWLAERLRESPEALVCLAAGATPARTYELLAERRESEPGLLRRVRLLKLDEWGGLEMSDPATCEQCLRRALVEPAGLHDHYVGFNSQPADPQDECARVGSWLQANGPIDVCVLGLGLNGHLGFNEPAIALQPHAHVAKLSAASLRHAMLSRTECRPAYGLTLGMADLLHARHVLLLVSGPAKRNALRRLLEGPLTTRFPASLLMLRPAVELLCDEQAWPTAAPERQ